MKRVLLALLAGCGPVVCEFSDEGWCVRDDGQGACERDGGVVSSAGSCPEAGYPVSCTRDSDGGTVWIAKGECGDSPAVGPP